MSNKKPKKVTLETISESINDLALATAKGFESVDERFEELETRLAYKMDHIKKNLSSQITSLDSKIDDLTFHKVRDEVYSLARRVTKIESRVGIKS